MSFALNKKTTGEKISPEMAQKLPYRKNSLNKTVKKRPNFQNPCKNTHGTPKKGKIQGKRSRALKDNGAKRNELNYRIK